jgi:hypothetical protein
LAVKYQQQYPIDYAEIGRKTVEQRENAKIRNKEKKNILKDEYLTNAYKNYKVELGQIKYKALQADLSVRRSVNEIKKTAS